ncbi:MAG: hypothetical protein NTV34_09130 [Proteobacteria bacterium]|nr:hypothetical protein [Pseudomonadota bacterium]
MNTRFRFISVVVVSALMSAGCMSSAKVVQSTPSTGVIKSHPREQAAIQPVIGFAFDWDDNIFEMPTQIMLFNKKTGAQKGVSTEEFALIRSLIGKVGSPWESYEMRPSVSEGSLRFFSDQAVEGKDFFAKDIEKAMTTPGYHWKGPVWDDFVTAMSQKRTADQTSIITARLHSPATIHRALLGLQRRGLIKNTLPEQNIWAVSYEGFDRVFGSQFKKAPPEGGAADPSARKAAVMESILDRITSQPLPEVGTPTVRPSGIGTAIQHLWGFSDDDFGNFSKAQSVLQKGVDVDRWPNVKITLFFTGTNNPTEKPRAIVLRPRAVPRPYAELSEWKGQLAEP